MPPTDPSPTTGETAPSGGGMGFLQRFVLRKFYAGAAGAPERLPWHTAKPTRLVDQAIARRGGRGRALDVGCGSGVHAAYLAKSGLDVTAIDSYPDAIAMARAVAAREEARVDVIQGDILAYRPAARFDLVLDSGCLHCMNRAGFAAYRRRILDWIVPGGDFVLAQFDRRHLLDWRPVGPRRRPSAAVVRAFAADFELIEKESEVLKVPLPIGPRVLGTAYWFRRRA